jgi:hypothetical protein
MRYQTCNPGQDGDGSETATLIPSNSLSNHNAETGAGPAYTGAPKHQRNESEATAVSPSNEHGNGLSEEPQSSTHHGNYDTSVPPTTQRGPLDLVDEKQEGV